MAIVFEVITGYSVDSEALSQGFLFRAGGTGDLDAVFGMASGGFAFGGGGLMEDSEDPSILVPSEGSGSFGFGMSAEAFDVEFSPGPTNTFFFNARSAEGDSGYGTFAFGGGGYEFAVATAYGFLVEQPAIITAYGGTVFETLEDEMVFLTDSSSILAYVLESLARFSDQVSPLATYLMTLQSSLVAADYATIVFNVRADSALILTDPTTAELRLIGLMADQLLLADETLGDYNALVTVVSSLVLHDAVIPVLGGFVDSELVLNDQTEARILAIVEAVSQLLLEDELEPILYLFATAESAMAFTDSPTANLALFAELLDNLHFGVRVRAGDDVFMGYSLNTRLAAVSEYSNYPFNSFAMIGGKPYGAAKGGIYRLDADDDDGDPINAHVRTGILNFEALTRVPNAWIGYTSSGELVFKTIIMDKGRKKENWYRMKARPDGAPVESRFDPAKGLLGTYWAFEIANLDGADFELDIVKIWPLRTQRRYSGR